MTNKEVMQQALECIERCNAHGWILADYEDEVYASIDALREALAQPEQEPVAWHYPGGSPDQCTTNKEYAEMEPAWTPLYAASPAAQRKWVGLTEFQFAEIYNKWNDTNGSTAWGLNQALEAKLRKLNT